MVVDTRKFEHSRFHESRNISESAKIKRYVSSPSELLMPYDIYWKSTSRLIARINANSDFTARDTPKGSFKVIEMNKSVELVGSRRIPLYLRTPVVAGDLHFLVPQMGVCQRGIFTHKGIETLPELVEVARPIKISCVNSALVDTVLDNNGKHVLRQVLSIVKSLVLECDWPIDRVEVRYVRDPEVKDWEYVLLLLVFTCNFDTADRHLHELYNHIDMLTSRLSNEEQEVLRRMIFFDIATKDVISSD